MSGLAQARFSALTLASLLAIGLTLLMLTLTAPSLEAAQASAKAQVSAKQVAKKTISPEAAPRLIIPKLRLNVILGSGADRRTLARGPAHIPGTSRPGESGNVGISGHRTMHTRPFNRLNALRTGDLVILGTGAGQIRYRVAWKKVVRPRAVSVLAATKVPSVTLTTCTPEGSARYRLVVRAVLVEG